MVTTAGDQSPPFKQLGPHLVYAHSHRERDRERATERERDLHMSCIHPENMLISHGFILIIYCLIPACYFSLALWSSGQGLSHALWLSNAQQFVADQSPNKSTLSFQPSARPRLRHIPLLIPLLIPLNKSEQFVKQQAGKRSQCVPTKQDDGFQTLTNPSSSFLLIVDRFYNHAIALAVEVLKWLPYR